MSKFELTGQKINENDPMEVFKAKMGYIIQESRDFDSGEISQMRQFIKDVEAGNMTIEDALAKAQALKDAKQNYH